MRAVGDGVGARQLTQVRSAMILILLSAATCATGVRAGQAGSTHVVVAVLEAENVHHHGGADAEGDEPDDAGHGRGRHTRDMHVVAVGGRSRRRRSSRSTALSYTRCCGALGTSTTTDRGVSTADSRSARVNAPIDCSVRPPATAIEPFCTVCVPRKGRGTAARRGLCSRVRKVHTQQVIFAAPVITVGRHLRVRAAVGAVAGRDLRVCGDVLLG